MAAVIGVTVEKIMTTKPPAASNDNARMHVLVWANAKDAFLRSSLSSSSLLLLLLLLFDIVQETCSLIMI